MNIKSFILVTTALLAVPVIGDCRPSTSYSRSSGSISAGTRSYTAPRSVSNYGSSGMSARNSMNRIGGNVANNWVSKSKPTPSASSSNSSNNSSNSGYVANTQKSYTAPTYQPAPTYHSAPQPDNSTSNFVSSLAGSYIGSRLANADNHSSDSHASANTQVTQVPQNQLPQNQPQNVPTVETPEHHSHILMWFFILLLITAAAGGATFYVLNKKKSEEDNEPEDKPMFYPGMSVTINPVIIESDPNSKYCPLHFAADANGNVTVVGVSQMGDIWHLYLDSEMNEFIRLYVTDGVVQEARFFSYINQYPIGTDSDMDEWIGNKGIIGSSVYMSEDQIKWKREVFPDSDEYISPNTEVEDIKTYKSHYAWKTVSCMYFRKTAFDMAFAQNEYLLISFLKGYDENHNPISYVKEWAGVDIPVASLNLVC